VVDFKLKNMKTSEITTCNCPWCGYQVDRSTGDGEPSEGDISICLKCLNLNTYESDLSLRKMNEDEYANLIGDKELKTKVEQYREAIRRTK
jgi:hypothetical protein